MTHGPSKGLCWINGGAGTAGVQRVFAGRTEVTRQLLFCRDRYARRDINNTTGLICLLDTVVYGELIVIEPRHRGFHVLRW